MRWKIGQSKGRPGIAGRPGFIAEKFILLVEHKNSALRPKGALVIGFLRNRKITSSSVKPKEHHGKFRMKLTITKVQENIIGFELDKYTPVH